MRPQVHDKTFLAQTVQHENRKSVSVEDVNNNQQEGLIQECTKPPHGEFKKKLQEKTLAQFKVRPKLVRRKSSSLTNLDKADSQLKIQELHHEPLRRYHSYNFPAQESDTHVDDMDGLLTTSLCSTEL